MGYVNLVTKIGKHYVSALWMGIYYSGWSNKYHVVGSWYWKRYMGS
jgi:hypothetical protein